MLRRGDKEHKKHKYLCSNPNCRKVFSRPKIIRYHVCPACQTFVNVPESENQDKTPTSFASKKVVKLKKLKIVKADKAEGKTLKMQPVSVGPSLKESSVSEKKHEGAKEPILPEQVQMSQQEKVETSSVQKTKTLEAETVSQASSNCKYGFGYLSQRKKGEKIPESCIECSKLLNCMLSNLHKKE